MKNSVICRTVVAGRVVVGPKKMSTGYARIVARKDGSGCIESYDARSKTWVEASATITFDEVWRAPLVPLLVWAGIECKV